MQTIATIVGGWVVSDTDDLTTAPGTAVAYVAQQLEVTPDVLTLL